MKTFLKNITARQLGRLGVSLEGGRSTVQVPARKSIMISFIVKASNLFFWRYINETEQSRCCYDIGGSDIGGFIKKDIGGFWATLEAYPSGGVGENILKKGTSICVRRSSNTKYINRKVFSDDKK